MKIVETIRGAGFQPTRETHIAVLRVYAKCGDIGTVLSEIKRLKSLQIDMKDKDILQLIYDLATSGHGASCKQLFDLLIKKGYYAHSAGNIVNRLIRKNHDEVAYSLLKTFPIRKTISGENINSGGFLLTYMVKANRSLKDIVAICQRLQDDGLHAAPFEMILPTLKEYRSADEVWSVLRECKTKGKRFVENNFQSLFDSANETELVDTLRTMIGEFNIHPSVKFLKAVVLPQLNNQAPNTAIVTLTSAAVTPTKAALAVAHRCLQQNQLKDAADIMNRFKLCDQTGVFRSVLISALKATNDVNSYVQFLRVQYENFNAESNKNENISHGRTSDAARSDALGAAVYATLIELSPRQRAATLTAILSGLVGQGVTISSMQAKRIENEIQTSMTDDISKYLDQLTSGDLELKPVKTPNLKIPSTSFRLERRIAQNKATNVMELLKAYHREGKIEKMEQLIERVENEKASVSPEVYALLIQGTLKAKDLTKAVEIYDKCQAQNREFTLSDDIVVEAASLFIDNGKFDEALQFVAKTKRTNELQIERMNENKVASPSYFSLLNRLAEEGKESEVNQLFNSFFDNGHLQVSSKLLSPLVKVHLVNGDTKKAVDAFERLAKQYVSTPFKRELCTHLIAAQDWVTLKHVVAICATVHGEANSLVDLALIFVECGQVHKAQQIFELPNLFISNEKIKENCNRYGSMGSIRRLDNLSMATKSAKGVKREPIFYNLLKLYIRADLPNKALDLWAQFQEHGEAPSDDFLFTLGTYLNCKNMDVPFQIPDRNEQVTNSSKIGVNSDKITPKIPGIDDSLIAS